MTQKRIIPKVTSEISRENLNIARKSEIFLCNTNKIKQSLDIMIVISYNYVVGGCFLYKNIGGNGRLPVNDCVWTTDITGVFRMSENLTEEIERARQEIKKLKIALRAEEIRTRISSEYTNFGLWEYDIATDICYQYKKLRGRYENNLEPIVHFRDSVIGQGIVSVDDIPVFKRFCDDMRAGKKEVECEIRIINDNSDIIWMRYEGRTVCDDEGTPIKVIGRTLDITDEKKQSEDDLNDRKDKLSNTISFSVFRDLVAEKRSGTSRYNNAALMCVGIDNFSEISATSGADYSDYIQKTVAKILVGINVTEPGSLVTRVRDGEFLLYLEFSDVEYPDDTARRVINAVNEYIYDGDPVTVSVGISIFKSEKKFDDVYSEALVALGEASKSGGKRFTHFSPSMSMGLYNFAPDFGADIDSASLSGGAAKVYDFIIRAFCDPKKRTAMIKEAFRAAGECMGAAEIYIFLRVGDGYERSDFGMGDNGAGNEYPAAEITCARADVSEAFGGTNSLSIHKADIEIEGIRLTNGAVSAEFRAVRYDGVIELVFAVVFDSEIVISDRDIQVMDVLESALGTMYSSYREIMADTTRRHLRTTVIQNHRVEGFSIIPDEFIVDDIGENASEHYGLSMGDICYRKIRGRDLPCEGCPAVLLKQNRTMFASSACYDKQERRWLDVTASVDENANGEKRYIISSADITDCLGKIQMTDGVTGLMTLNVFMAEALRLTAAESEDNQGIYAVVLNVADFSRINEEKGYEMGNAILICIADILRQCASVGELVCRAEGSRFDALLRSPDLNAFKSRMKLLLTSIRKQVYEKLQVHIYLLVGVCNMNDEPIGVMGAVDRAIVAQKTIRDRASYNENILVFYDGVMRNRIKERRFIESNMTAALENNEFHVYYQPKVNIETGKVVGAEALVRWIRSNGEIISPGKFVPIFEENGFITEMDFAIYRQSVADIAKWLRMGYEVPLISLNVSRRHLADDTFCNKFNSLVDGIGVPHDYIELEITESLLTENLDNLIRVTTWFKERGYRISIDDFGSGYSSLNLITMLPFDTLKIDGGFFLRNDLTDKNKKVITSVVSLAKSLNLETVSEGVETQVQVDFLKALGCDMIQGFFYYKPMPGSDFEKVIAAQGK